MRVLKFLLCGLLMALPVFAEESEDRQTATSLRYVSHELDTRQNKLSAGSNKALTYTNAAGNVEQRTVKSNLTGGTTDTSLPMAEAVNAGLDTKQDDIAAINDHTAVTYTGQVGTIGQKGIYQDTGTYATQTNNLIDAKTFNAALKNGLDNEFVCADRPDAHAPGTNTCWLWEIHNVMTVPYVSATGTGVQNGTPTPTNPIYPTFYRQGDMILRKVGDYADSYDATTHKITRRVGVKVLDGTEPWVYSSTWSDSTHACYYFLFNKVMPQTNEDNDCFCTHFEWYSRDGLYNDKTIVGGAFSGYSPNVPRNGISLTLRLASNLDTTVFDAWLAEQYAAGTPVTVYYPLAEPVEEDWPETTYNSNIYIPQNQ